MDASICSQRTSTSTRALMRPYSLKMWRRGWVERPYRLDTTQGHIHTSSSFLSVTPAQHTHTVHVHASCCAWPSCKLCSTLQHRLPCLCFCLCLARAVCCCWFRVSGCGWHQHQFQQPAAWSAAAAAVVAAVLLHPPIQWADCSKLRKLQLVLLCGLQQKQIQ